MATLYRSDFWVKSVLGQAIAGAQVYVCTQPANLVVPPSPLATIFSDPSGLVTLTQPIQSDGFGHINYYTASGFYTVIIVTGGAIQQLYKDQTVGLPGLIGGGTVTNNEGPLVSGSVVVGGPLGGADVADSGVPVLSLATVSQLNAETSRAEAAEALLAPIASPTFTGTATSPAINTRTLNTNILFADQFVGGDVGAKVNAADAALGATPGEIWVTAAAGTTISTTIALSSNRVLRFFGGTWTVSTAGALIHGVFVNAKSNVHVIGDGIGSTILTVSAGGTQLGDLVNIYNSTDCSVENMTLLSNNNSTNIITDEINTRPVLNRLRMLADITYNSGRNYCLHIRGSVYGRYEDLHCEGGSQDAILVGLGPFGAESQACQFAYFRDIWCQNSPFNGIDLGGSASLPIVNNTFVSIVCIGNGGYSSGVDDRNGINLNYANGNVFTNVISQSNQYSGIRINGGSDNVFVGISSSLNGQAGPGLGDGIRLENAVVGFQNLNNFFQGVSHSFGSNYAVGTSGIYTYINTYYLNIGSSAVNLLGSGGVDFLFAQGASGSPLIYGALNLQSGTITTYNGVTLQGNGVPAEYFSDKSATLTANYNAGSAKTLFTPAAAGMWRIAFSQGIVRAASSSSTFPSLTLGWTDAGGIARTKQVIATSATNTTAVEADGVAVIYTNGSTAVTVTSASYASSGGTTMEYALSVTAERLS